MASIPIFQKAKRLLRIVIAYFLYYTGILNLLLSIKLKDKAVVLMYHRVLNADELSKSYSHNGIIVTKKTFADQMQFLKSHFNVIPLSEVIHKIKNKIPFVSKSCLITFDDGWKDNYNNAFPILKKNQIPAAIFLPTDFVETGKAFWQEKLTQLLTFLYLSFQKDSDLKLEFLNSQNTEGLSSILNSNEKDVKEKIFSFIARQKHKGESYIENLIHRFETLIQPSRENMDQYQDFVSWEEIQVMAKQGIDFGSHGKSHQILTNDEADIQLELNESKIVIEDMLNTKIDSFSYPNGNYSEKIVNLVMENKYEVAFGTENGFVSNDDDSYTLKRINIHEDMTNNIPMFLARIVGLW